MAAVLQMPPLALYVHLPWCVRKCPYCDFNSHAAPDQLPQRDYVNAILEDLDHDLAIAADRPLESIFLWDPLESTCRHASLSIL